MRAALAIAHKILVSAYHMLAKGLPSRDLGEAYLDQIGQTRTVANLKRRLERLGALTGPRVSAATANHRPRSARNESRPYAAFNFAPSGTTPSVSSLPVDRRARRAKTDMIDAEMLLRTLMAWLRGEPRVCSMVPIPSEADEEARRAYREREDLTRERRQGFALFGVAVVVAPVVGPVLGGWLADNLSWR